MTGNISGTCLSALSAMYCNYFVSPQRIHDLEFDLSFLSRCHGARHLPLGSGSELVSRSWMSDCVFLDS